MKKVSEYFSLDEQIECQDEEGNKVVLPGKNMVFMILNVIATPEVKGIRGSDRRKFILDLARLSPRDTNWIGEGDEYLCCLVRPELISHFLTSKNFQYAKEQIKQDIADKKEPSQTAVTDSKKETTDQSDVQITEVKPGQDEEQKEAEKTGLSYLDYINKLQEYLSQNDNKNRIRFNPNLYTRVNLSNQDNTKIEGNYLA